MVATEQLAAQALPYKLLRCLEHLRLCAPETVDALLGIAHNKHAGRIAGTAVGAEPRPQSLPLQGVGVLKLVDQQVPDARVQPLLHPARQHLVAQQDPRHALNVIHVHPAALALECGELSDQEAA